MDTRTLPRATRKKETMIGSNNRDVVYYNGESFDVLLYKVYDGVMAKKRILITGLYYYYCEQNPQFIGVESLKKVELRSQDDAWRHCNEYPTDLNMNIELWMCELAHLSQVENKPAIILGAPDRFTHWGLVMYICVDKLVNISSSYGLMFVWH